MKIYQIATPAPRSILLKELEKLLGVEKILPSGFKFPDGLESVTMINLSDEEIEKIEDEIGDVLINEF